MASGDSSGGTRELQRFSEKGLWQVSMRTLALVLVAERTRGHSLEWAGGREGALQWPAQSEMGPSEAQSFTLAPALGRGVPGSWKRFRPGEGPPPGRGWIVADFLLQLSGLTSL